MAFPVAMIPMLLAAVRGLVKYRTQLDRIFVGQEAAADLPFALPPAPEAIAEHIGPMVTFFETEPGKAVLQLADTEQQFRNRATITDAQRKELVCLYLETDGLELEPVGPGRSQITPIPGPDTEARLAYFMVSSHRLSRNRTVTRVVLATADTLLDFAGENASVFVSDPKTAAIVSTLLKEFAGETDLDDLPARRIVHQLLGAAVIAAIDNRGHLPDHPALTLLYSAIADVRRAHPDDAADFVSNIITKQGFRQVVSTYLTQAGQDTKFTGVLAKLATGRDADDEMVKLARGAFSAMLNELGKQNMAAVLEDPKSLSGVLEAGLAAAAKNAAPVLSAELGGRPLLAVVLASVAESVEDNAGRNELFKNAVKGEFWASLYRTSLEAVAANPAAIGASGGVDPFVADWIAAVADELAKTPLAELEADSGIEVVRRLASRSLDVLAAHPEFIAGNRKFAAAVAGAVLAATAPLVRDGLEPDDIVPLMDAAVSAAADNLALAGLGSHLTTILVSLSEPLREGGVRPLLTHRGRRDTLIAGVQAVAANPKIWQDLIGKDAGAVQPLIEGLVLALATSQSKIVSGTVMVDAVRKSLSALSLRGADWVDQYADNRDELTHFTKVMEEALTRADAELGKTINRENLPEFIERVVLAFLEAPVDSNDNAKVRELLNAAVAGLNAP